MRWVFALLAVVGGVYYVVQAVLRLFTKEPKLNLWRELSIELDPSYDQAKRGKKPPRELLQHEPKGVILGKYWWHYLTVPAKEIAHFWIIALTRGGKTTKNVFNTLISWPYTFFVTDTVM